MRKIFWASAAALLLAGCGGSDAEVPVDTGDGEQVLVRSGERASGGLPDGFSLYPDATIVTSTQVKSSDGSGTLIVMTTDASPVEVIAFYRDQAEAAGVTIANEANMNGMMLIGGEDPDGVAFTASASPGGDGQTSIQLSAGKGL